MAKKSIEYSIERKTIYGEWVEELCFDTYEEAKKALKLCPGQPKEKYRIVANEFTVIWEREKKL